MSSPLSLPDSLVQRIVIDEVTGCWVWTGAWTTPRGYGRLSYQRQRWVAHRLVYTLLVGPVPDELELDHAVCQRPLCVNPDHLEPVTGAENMRRRRTANCPVGHARTPKNRKQAGGCRECDRVRRRARYRESKEGATVVG